MAIIRKFTIIGIAVMATSTAFGECGYPREVSVPDGTSATTDQMVAGQEAVKVYMAEMEAYLACLDAEVAAEAETEEQTEEAKALHVKRYNAAVDSMESVAARFNDEVRAYKAKNP